MRNTRRKWCLSVGAVCSPTASFYLSDPFGNPLAEASHAGFGLVLTRSTHFPDCRTVMMYSWSTAIPKAGTLARTATRCSPLLNGGSSSA